MSTLYVVEDRETVLLVDSILKPETDTHYQSAPVGRAPSSHPKFRMFICKSPG